jgi:hypothetical protein
VRTRSDQHGAHCTGYVSALVMRCGAGDVRAFGALFDLLVDVVRARAAAWSREDDVDDAVCAAFLDVWEHSASFEPGPQNGVDWVLDRVAASLAGKGAQDFLVGDTGFEPVTSSV